MNTEQKLDKWITTLRRIKDEMDDVTNDLNDIHFGSNLSRTAQHLEMVCQDLDDSRVDIPLSDYDYGTCPKCGQETCNDVCPECGDMTDPQNPNVRV